MFIVAEIQVKTLVPMPNLKIFEFLIPSLRFTSCKNK